MNRNRKYGNTTGVISPGYEPTIEPIVGIGDSEPEPEPLSPKVEFSNKNGEISPGGNEQQGVQIRLPMENIPILRQQQQQQQQPLVDISPNGAPNIPLSSWGGFAVPPTSTTPSTPMPVVPSAPALPRPTISITDTLRPSPIPPPQSNILPTPAPQPPQPAVAQSADSTWLYWTVGAIAVAGLGAILTAWLTGK